MHNPSLPILKSGWTGNPLDANGRFVNHEHPFTTGFADMLKWQFSPKPNKEAKKNDPWRLPVVQDSAWLHATGDTLVWLGHASFYLRLGGKTLLIDPVLFNVGPVKRLSPLPLSPTLLQGVDYLLVSHDHRDHCDTDSLKLLSRQNPQAKILTGLKMKPLLQGMVQKGHEIQEAGWYQCYETPAGDPEVIYLPARHWGRRLIADTNMRLWGAFLIRWQGKTLYFSADTGYGSHLREVGELFGPVDTCIIGVGAYQPEWFMAAAHISPTNAVRAVHEMGAKAMIPMHFGTFDLSDEAPGDPLRVLQAMQAAGEIQARLITPAAGEAVGL